MSSSVSGATNTRVAVVTGGLGAIGAAIVRQLRESGHRVVALDRNGDYPVDLSSEIDTRRAGREILAAFGRCDVLVHSAAAFDQMVLEDVTSGSWRHVQNTNVESLLWLAQELVPGMQERGFGRIVVVVSNTVWLPPAPWVLAYVASKGALIAMMRSLAVSLGDHGISVTAVAPGLTDTPGSRTANSDEDFAAVVRQQSLKRPLLPDDTASAVAFLVSDGGAALTGQVLVVDGGLVKR